MSETTVTRVEPGETLSEIAARYDVSVEELQRWNGIENPDFVQAGQTVVIYSSMQAPSPDLSVGSSNMWMGGIVVLAFFLFLLGRKRSSSTRRKYGAGTITGKAYVTDGDGIRVSGQEVRIAGLDAPEWNQPAKHREGYWFAHGRRVKSALIREIGGRPVHVSVERYDKFGRAVGTVTCYGRDIGAWLVREGHARALYSDRYAQVEEEAKRAKRGMWGHAVNIDPRKWRHRNRSRS